MQTVISDKQLHLNLANGGGGGGSANSPPYTPSFQPNTPEQEPQYDAPSQSQATGKSVKTHSARGTITSESDGLEDLDLTSPVSTLLRLGTQRAHVKAEHSAGAAALVQGGLGLEEYIRWLAVLWRIYDALELGLAEHSSNPVLAPTYDPALLARAPALAEDITYLLTLLPSSSNAVPITITPSSSLAGVPLPPFALPPFLEEIFVSPPYGLQNYLDRIKALSSSSASASRLLAHAYVRYLGDLSGGQFIGARVKKSYDLSGENGTKFYYFEFQKGMTAPGDDADGAESRHDAKKRLNEVKDWYRRGMDEGVGEDQALKADLVEEANVAFALNTDLFSVIRLPSSTTSSVSAPGSSPSTKIKTGASATTEGEAEVTLADKLSSFIWFGAAAVVGVLLNIYVQPIVADYFSGNGSERSV